MTSPENEQEDKEDVVSHPDLRARQRDSASEQLTSQGYTSVAGSAGAGEFHTVEELQQRLGVAGRTISQLQRSLYETSEQRITSERRRQRKKCTRLFILTFLSTFLVGAQFFPLEYVLGLLVPRYGQFVNVMMGGRLDEVAWQTAIAGISYAVPVMGLLLFHEMGHYLQAVRYRVPASLPYFIPMPLPPMGTMGAVIFQGQGTATRRQMFDIAVSGPLAGLAVILPVLWFGLRGSGYQPVNAVSGLEFGDPLLMTWMIEYLHGPEPAGHVFALNQVAFAGWVGVLITSLNLLPVGQLDGGHILYTLIGRWAHYVAMAVIGVALGGMILFENYSFTLLLILMMLTGIKHPPTADDSESLGWHRHLIGWLTLAFLVIGFTPNPISVPSGDRGQPPAAVEPADEDAPEILPVEIQDMMA